MFLLFGTYLGKDLSDTSDDHDCFDRFDKVAISHVDRFHEFLHELIVE